MEVPRTLIWTVRHSKEDVLSGTVDGEGHDPQHLAANPDLKNFRVVMTNVVEGSSGVWIPSDAADALELKAEDNIRFSPLEHKAKAATAGE